MLQTHEMKNVCHQQRTLIYLFVFVKNFSGAERNSYHDKLISGKNYSAGEGSRREIMSASFYVESSGVIKENFLKLCER